jgi:hypothetical protein
MTGLLICNLRPNILHHSDDNLEAISESHLPTNAEQSCLSTWPDVNVLTDDNKAERMMASLFPATLCKKGKQLCASGHLVRRHGSIISLPLVSSQPCSGNTLAYPGSSIK